jgi:preprotein translocase subunit SecF
MNIVENKRIFFWISGILVAAAIGAVVFFGLNLSIDFTGGSITEIQYEGESPSIEQVESQVQQMGFASVSVRPTGEGGYIIRTPFLESQQHQDLLDTLTFPNATSTPTNVTRTAASAATGTGAYQLTEQRFSSIGPAVGSELRTKALWGLGLVIAGIILFIAFAFRKVSEPVSSWKYGLVAIAALIHDIALPVGVFAVLSATMGAQVDVLFVMALLAILGYSVNDTIVVFDRTRENLKENKDLNRKEPFARTVGRSLEQTYTRSVNTSLTTGLVLLALYFFGAASTQLFALVLLVGVLAGTYSSIFLASPLLVQVYEWQIEE